MNSPWLSPLFQNFWPYTIALSRWLSFVLVMPGFGEMFISSRIRLLLALGLSACITPFLLAQGLLSVHLSVSFFFQEIIVGLFLGLLVRLLVEMASMAGNLISYEMSLMNLLNTFFQADTHDLLQTFLKIYFITLIFATDLHLMFFKGLYQSYSFFPAGQPLLFSDMVAAVLEWVAQGFRIAVQMSAPFLICGICYYVLLGLVSRLVPQVPFFFVARPLELGLGFLILLIALMAIAVTFHESVQDLFAGFLAS